MPSVHRRVRNKGQWGEEKGSWMTAHQHISTPSDPAPQRPSAPAHQHKQPTSITSITSITSVTSTPCAALTGRFRLGNPRTADVFRAIGAHLRATDYTKGGSKKHHLTQMLTQAFHTTKRASDEILFSIRCAFVGAAGSSPTSS